MRCRTSLWGCDTRLVRNKSHIIREEENRRFKWDFSGKGVERRMIRFLIISVFHSCIPAPAMILFPAPGQLWLPCCHLITRWAKAPYGASGWEWCSWKFWQAQGEQITGELALWACLQWEWSKPLFPLHPLFPGRFSQIFVSFGEFDLWGNILKVAGRQSMCFVPLESWNNPKLERGGFSCSVSLVVQKESVGGGCLVHPGTNQICWSCDSLRNGIEPNKEGAAKEQIVAGGGAFTWTKEGLGLSPVCVRLKSTAWAAAECQEPTGQSRALSKPFESLPLSLSQEQMLSPSSWMLGGAPWEWLADASIEWLVRLLGLPALSDTKCQPAFGEMMSDKH